MVHWYRSLFGSFFLRFSKTSMEIRCDIYLHYAVNHKQGNSNRSKIFFAAPSTQLHAPDFTLCKCWYWPYSIVLTCIIGGIGESEVGIAFQCSISYHCFVEQSRNKFGSESNEESLHQQIYYIKFQRVVSALLEIRNKVGRMTKRAQESLLRKSWLILANRRSAMILPR